MPVGTAVGSCPTSPAPAGAPPAGDAGHEGRRSRSLWRGSFAQEIHDLRDHGIGPLHGRQVARSGYRGEAGALDALGHSVRDHGEYLLGASAAEHEDWTVDIGQEAPGIGREASLVEHRLDLSRAFELELAVLAAERAVLGVEAQQVVPPAGEGGALAVG